MATFPILHELTVSLLCICDAIRRKPKIARQRWKDYAEESFVGSGIYAAIKACRGDYKDARKLGKGMGRATGKILLGGGILKDLPIFHELATCGESLGDMIGGGDYKSARQRWRNYANQSFFGSAFYTAHEARIGNNEHARELGKEMAKATGKAVITSGCIAVVFLTGGLAAHIAVPGAIPLKSAVSTVVLTSAPVGICALDGRPIDAADLGTFAVVRMVTSVAGLLDSAVLSFTLLHASHTANMELILNAANNSPGDHIQMATIVHTAHSTRDVFTIHTPHTMFLEHSQHNMLDHHSQTHVPDDHTQNNASHDHTQNNAPDDNTQNNAPDADTQNNAPDDNTQNNVPDDHTQNSVPDDYTQNNASHDHTQNNVSHDHIQNNAPDDDTQNNASHDHTQNNVPDDHTQNNAPDDNTQNSVPDDHTQNNASHDHTQNNAPDDHTQNIVPDDHIQNNAPDDHTQNNAPDDHTQNNATDDHTQNSISDDLNQKNVSGDANNSILNTASTTGHKASCATHPHHLTSHTGHKTSTVSKDGHTNQPTLSAKAAEGLFHAATAGPKSLPVYGMNLTMVLAKIVAVLSDWRNNILPFGMLIRIFRGLWYIYSCINRTIKPIVLNLWDKIFQIKDMIIFNKDSWIRKCLLKICHIYFDCQITVVCPDTFGHEFLDKENLKQMFMDSGLPARPPKLSIPNREGSPQTVKTGLSSVGLVGYKMASFT